MRKSKQIGRRAWLIFALILGISSSSLAQSGGGPKDGKNNPGKHLSREVRTDKGNTAHILFTPEMEKQFRAEQAQKAADGAIGFAVTANNLVYNGGPVMRNPTNYLIFWQPPGRAAFPAGYQAAIEKYFQNVGGTPFYNIVTQYNDNTGVVVPNATSLGAPSYTDTTTNAPSGCNGSIGDIGATPNCPLTDGDIQAEVTSALAANPAWARPGINVEYFVFTPSDAFQCNDASNSNNPNNAADCFAINGTLPADNTEQKSYCAYHSFFNGNTIYAYQPFASNGTCFGNTNVYPNIANYPNSVAVDVELSPVSHEMIESNTDPHPGNTTAWTGPGGLSDEIGDKCAYNYGFVAPDGTTLVLNGNRFQTQQEWSNDVTGCTKRYGADPGTSDPASIDFSEVEAGQTAEKDLVIQNTAGGDLNILNVRLGPTASSYYTLLNVPPLAATLHSSESLTVQVQLAPTAGASFGHPAATVLVDTDQTTFNTTNGAVSSENTTNVTGTVGISPVASCQNVTVNTDLNLCTTAVASVNNGSTDPDGETITVTQSPGGPYTLGVTPVTLLVSDTEGVSASCPATVTVQDHQPPSITCPAPQTIMCTSASGAAANLHPTVFDNCPAVTSSCVPPSGSTFGFGTTAATCKATDASGNMSMCSTTVTVVDVPPVISSVVASPNVLRPPNKKLDPVTILVKDTDLCDPTPDCSISAVATNSGPAVAGSDYVITGPLSLELKAAGNGGHALTYIVSVTCADHHGGSTTAQTTVQAPL
jgi:hypothetical protein